MGEYTALEQMRSINQKRYGIDGPLVPEKFAQKELSGNLEEYALEFIREQCGQLRFSTDESHMALEDLDGRSTTSGQIPLNMERDLDRLCLEQAIHRFMRTGTAADAFDIYFCYLEMFVGNYNNSRKMIEFLAEFESNGSSLLMKHRDHYSHSVYVFLLGLALYQKAPLIQESYQSYYGFSSDDPQEKQAAAHQFLRDWGMTALFHDVGYPFELPFEQVKSYFGGKISGHPYVAYRGIEDYKLPQELLRQFLTPDMLAEVDGLELSPILVLAENLADKLYPTYSGFVNYRNYLERNSLTDNKSSYRTYLAADVLRKKPEHPESFGGFMDHAVFSAVILMGKLTEAMPDRLHPCLGDVLTAIVLHNSMYKFSVTNVKEKQNVSDFNRTHHITPQLHPLAYLLMLCDELQCWDRVAYGQNSRQEFHPCGFDMEITENHIRAIYSYDEAFGEERKDSGTYRKMEPDDKGCSFLRDIEDIIRINEDGDAGLSLEICRTLAPRSRKTEQYLSSSSFLHLYNFAVALNAQYEARDYTTGEFKPLSLDYMEKSFSALSLEYKLSNIAQAKAFGKYLDLLGCFFTDRQVDYPLKRSFTSAEQTRIGLLEHERWNREKHAMGWQYGTAYEQCPNGSSVNKKLIREQTRTHNDLDVDYSKLSLKEQLKDTAPFNDMMRLIEQYDGLRVYTL